jgi:carbamoyl-phosphate synthase small subunit
MTAPKVLLLLSDGYTAEGLLVGKPGTTVGKLVFNTSMAGYQEILTDPSYAGEIVVFTFPLIGIYGAAEQDRQSSRIHARGLVVSELSAASDNWRADRTLTDLLLLEGVTGIRGIDTRRLTKHLRDSGEMYGVITSELDEAGARELLAAQPDFGAADFVREVTCEQPYMRLAGQFYREPVVFRSLGNLFAAPAPPPQHCLRVAAYDFGIKHAIIDCLSERACEVHVFPATAKARELLAIDPDGVFLSNGPGDPARMNYVLPELTQLIELSDGSGGRGRPLPIFGICLGHQLLARAAGLPTYRLKFGNRGANHPVLELASGRVHISSQNHSYAVALSDGPGGRPAAAEIQELAGSSAGQSIAPESRRPLGDDRPRAPYPHPLNPGLLVTHLNVNDSSCEGLAWADKPIFCVQYHPEGSPGPRDNTYLFDRFVEHMTGAPVTAEVA